MGERTETLEVHLETAVVKVGTGAARAPMRSFSSVEAFVKLEMDELSKAGRTQLALVGPLT